MHYIIEEYCRVFLITKKNICKIKYCVNHIWIFCNIVLKIYEIIFIF